MKSNLIEVSESLFAHVFLELEGMPTHFYYRGTLPEGRVPTVAIVGTRRPSHYGKQVTYDLAYKLAQKGVIIVSGLALGCDTIAHRAALDAGGKTIAILAGGLDSIYPRTNARLAEEIIKNGGALISEYPDGMPAKPFQFLARNRIVSGLADAVVVTEAAARSGTLSTVAHALDQNKEVFAIPGNITSVLSVGPNRLLKQGASPALSAEDILDVIAPSLLTTQTELPLETTPLERTILELIQSGIHDTNTLQLQTKKQASEVASTLTMLEIKGIIRTIDGNNWTLL